MLHQSIALKNLYKICFECRTIASNAKPEIHENCVREYDTFLCLQSRVVSLRMNLRSDHIGTKRF